jgi:hypothetical protein
MRSPDELGEEGVRACLVGLREHLQQLSGSLAQDVGVVCLANFVLAAGVALRGSPSLRVMSENQTRSQAVCAAASSKTTPGGSSAMSPISLRELIEEAFLPGPRDANALVSAVLLEARHDLMGLETDGNDTFVQIGQAAVLALLQK